MGFIERLLRFLGWSRRRDTWDPGPEFEDWETDDYVDAPVAADAAESGGRVLPGFQTSAGDQLERGQSSKIATARIKLRDAFTPSRPVHNARMFAGRLNVLSKIIRAIEDQRLHVVLYGPRGIGKTSLLMMVSEAAREAKYVVAYTSCGATSDFDSIFRSACEQIPLIYHRDYKPSDISRSATLAEALPSETMTPQPLYETFERLTGTRVIIVLDEFDRSQSLDFRQQVAELIKNLSDRSIRVQLVLAGVAEDASELVQHIPSIRRNILPIRVPLMTLEEIEELAANGQQATGLVFEDAPVHLVAEASHGVPYLATLLFQNAAAHALDNGRIEVTTDDVLAGAEQGADELKERLNGAMQSRIRRARVEHPQAIRVLARACSSAAGTFDDAEIRLVAEDEVAAADAINLANTLSREGVLMSMSRDDAGPRYGFLDDGVIPYLWLSEAPEAMKQPAEALT